MTTNEDFLIKKPKTPSSRMLAEKMMPLLVKHIGRKNSISKSDLFKFCFDKRYSPKSYADFFRAECMRRGLHYLRVNSTCFVTSYRDEGDNGRYFSVVSSNTEAEEYCAVLTASMKKMQAMQKRARKAVKEQWHKKPFRFTRSINVK